MNKETYPKLTPLEREILNHRLTCPDGLADVFDEEHSAEDVEKVCSLLLKGDIEGALKLDEVITADVLADAVEGSTYYGNGISLVSDRKQDAILKTGRSLAVKIGTYIGRKLVYPKY